MMFGFALSGLQAFLYDLSPQSPSREERMNSGAGGGGRDRDAARRLRIRSAMLSLVPSLVAKEIHEIDKGDMPLYLGGGKLLMAATEQAIASLDPKLVQLYEWFQLHSGGRLGIYWTTAPGAASDAAVVKDLLRRLNTAKWKAGRFDGWIGTSGTIRSLPEEQGLGNRDWESKQGNRFAKSDDWAGFNVGFGDWQIGPWRVGPAEGSADIPLDRDDQQTHHLTVSIPAYTPKLARDVTTEKDDLKKGDIIPLHLLAEQDADGDPRPGGAYLALLKLDGDGIGELMKRSLDDGVGRYREVSGKLVRFFGAQMMDFLKNKYPRLYLVYSGGDDLVATGHFDDVVRAARDIQEQFAALGPNMAASAGISFYTRNSPILKAVEAAEQELESAKEQKPSVSLGGCRMTWPELKTTLDQVDGLERAFTSEQINRGALQLLRELGEPWLADAPVSLCETRWRSIPQMHYMRSRRTGWKESEWPAQVRELFDSLQAKEDDWPRATLIGTLAAWKTKKRQEEQ